MQMIKFDDNQVRYRQVTSLSGKQNWLFVPGGPGVDSAYFEELILSLNLPGTTWLVDLPGNGSNSVTDDFDYEQWLELVIPMVQQFDNPIWVGHSFGAMLPLLFPELESLLKGLVILNSAPCLWLEAAADMAQKKNIVVLTKPMLDFTNNPNPETFALALEACLPYYFPPETMARGKKLLLNLPFNYHAANWWQRKSQAIEYTAQWIPEKTPVLIISGTEDCIVPHYLFENDQRFKRTNIHYHLIQNAGHLPWLEAMEQVKAIWTLFCKLITTN